MTATYAREQNLSVEDYVGVLGDTIMRDKRPLTNRARIAEMLAGTNLVVTAREDGAILGLARCITDNAWICYCAELAVKETAQGRGIGAGIMAKLYELLGPKIGLILISEPGAVGFYERVGMDRHESAFFRTRLDRA